MKIQNLLKTSSEWVKGENGGNRIVFSSRLRLARNVNHHPFPGWAKKAEREKVLALVQPAVAELPEMREAVINDSMEHFTPLEKQVLVEQHLISREHAAKNAGSGLIVNKPRTLSFMINEEDHLRMQAIRAGLQLKNVFKMIDKADSALEERLDFAFRMALAARAMVYGESLKYQSPLFRQATAELQADGTTALRVWFDQADGLNSSDKAVKGFEVAGEDRKFVAAQARVDGGTVVVSAAALPHPVYVRYAWASYFDTNLYNAAGLPASTFSSDYSSLRP